MAEALLQQSMEELKALLRLKSQSTDEFPTMATFSEMVYFLVYFLIIYYNITLTYLFDQIIIYYIFTTYYYNLLHKLLICNFLYNKENYILKENAQVRDPTLP